MSVMLESFIEHIRLRHHVDKLRYLTDRQAIWEATRSIRGEFHDAILAYVSKAKILERMTGLALASYDVPEGVRRRGGVPVFSVHALREARRLKEDGRTLNQVFFTILQKVSMEHEGRMHTIRCGSTVVVDLDELRVTYVIGKGLHDRDRLQRIIAFKEGRAGIASLAATYFGATNEPFAALHSPVRS